MCSPAQVLCEKHTGGEALMKVMKTVQRVITMHQSTRLNGCTHHYTLAGLLHRLHLASRTHIKPQQHPPGSMQACGRRAGLKPCSSGEWKTSHGTSASRASHALPHCCCACRNPFLAFPAREGWLSSCSAGGVSNRPPRRMVAWIRLIWVRLMLQGEPQSASSPRSTACPGVLSLLQLPRVRSW